MHTGRVAAAVALVAVVMTTLPSPAHAQTTPGGSGNGAGGWRDPGGGTVTVEAGSSSSTLGTGGGPSTGRSGSSSGCSWVAQGSQGPTNPGIGGYSEGPNGPTPVSGTASGAWYLEVCPGSPGGLFFVPTGTPPKAVVTPRQLSVEAENQLTPPRPSVQTSPATAHRQIAHVPTWVWIPAADWVPLHATASVPGVVVTATATPVKIDITYRDDGATHNVVCNGPGTPYSDALADAEFARMPDKAPAMTAIIAPSPDCGWTYRYSSAGEPNEAVPVSVRVVYDASWTVTGAAGGGRLGTVTSAPENLSLQVEEIQALNVAGS
jgi:hypothetical protein